MAVINPYTDKVTSSGTLNVQADPNSFGANVGAAVQNLGNAGLEVANVLHQNEVTNDVTNVHVELAKKRAEWQQKIVDMTNATQPGDDTLAPRIMDEMAKDFEKLGSSFKTRQGQQTFARMSADMTSMFGQEAVGIQSRLDGEFAKNQYKDLTSALGTIASQDHTQIESLIKQGLAAIDDPYGRFAKVPEPTREAFRKSIVEELQFDAAKGFVRRYPNAALGSIPPALRTEVQSSISGIQPPVYNGPNVSDIQVPANSPDANPANFGTRPDGTAKGSGFLGVLQRPDGGVSTEITVGVNIDGKEMDIPTLVPTLTRKEVNTLLSLKDNEPIPEPIIDKAVAFASKRLSEGKSVFADPNENPYASKTAQPTQGLPPNLGASVVKPYDQSGIDSRVKTIAQPSPFDKTFQAAGQLYNIDWRELKMRAVAESNLNPHAVSGQNAGGIMQFTPEMAKQLGVNSSDPVASIFAAAKLISDYRNKAGGDMSKVDMMYYGGEGGTAWGDNTKQYAANLAALRLATGLSSPVSPSVFTPNPSDVVGQSQDWKKPTTGIGFIDKLPPDKFFSILSEAEHYQRAYEAMSDRSRAEKMHLDQKAQEATMDGFYQRVINPTMENGGKLTEIDVISNPILTAAQKQHMIDTMSARTRELVARADRSNPEKVRELMLQIHAPDNDPTKIYNDDPLYAALKKGEISTGEFKVLQNDIRALKDGSTNGFQKDVNNARNIVFRTLQQNVRLQAMEMAEPGTIADISYRFDRDMEKQIEAYRKQNKDPRVLLDPNSKDYLLAPGRISSFFPSTTATLNNGASQAAKQDRTPDAGLTIGKQYKVNGTQMTYLGGPKNLSTSWQ